MDVRAYVEQLGLQARKASQAIAKAETAMKNAALQAMAAEIESAQTALLEANAQDLEQGKANGLDAALLDRLELNPERILAMSDGLRQVAALPDPVGEISGMNYRPSGIQVGKMRVPLGVIGIIYESRPNVTAEAAGLCLKSGNACILRGGSEAFHSNQVIAACLHKALASVGLPAEVVQVMATTDRVAVSALITMSEAVDVIVPRGGQGLIERIASEATVPVIMHLHGVCHVYIDDKADMDKAVAVALNSKTQRYGTCNTMETLLVAEGIAATILPTLAARYKDKGVELRGCQRTCELLTDVVAATDEDWATEYLAPILSVRIVTDMDEAIEHIRCYGSGHTEAVVTEDYSKARKFLREVDSSSVMVNASTRFADGFEYGLGAEIGISTNKLHARGPVGLEGLTTQKYIVLGDGHIRG